jgi:glycosyltransferase involved in cell wall biosynthesis
MHKLLVISQLPIWDIEKNSGKAVMDKTFEGFSKKFDLTIIAPGAIRIYNNSKFYSISNKLHDKTKNYKYIGHFLNYFYLFYFFIQVKKVIKKNNLSPDIVYSVGYYGTFTAAKIFKKRKTFIVNRYYGVAWNEKNNTFKEKIRFFLKNKCFKKNGDFTVMTNDGTKGKLFLNKMGINSRDILFLKNGIEMKYEIKQNFKANYFKENKLEKDTFIFLTVSRLAEWKKVDRAILLMSKLKNTYNNIHLLIVGTGEEKENLQNLSESLGVKENVNFVGSITHEELPNYYNSADSFLSLYNYSNAGNPLFEAMLHEKKIITIGNGDTKAFINSDGALLLEEYNEDELLKKATYLISNPEECQIMANNAHNQLKESFLSWEDRVGLEINAILKVYNEYTINN